MYRRDVWVRPGYPHPSMQGSLQSMSAYVPVNGAGGRSLLATVSQMLFVGKKRERLAGFRMVRSACMYSLCNIVHC